MVSFFLLNDIFIIYDNSCLILVPSAGPSKITGQNTSSSSITVTWDDVPFDHKNGIIIGYEVYINGSGNWYSEETSEQTFSKAGLDLWTFYDIKVSAKTSVGEGVRSDAIRVRTDEDRK